MSNDIINEDMLNGLYKYALTAYENGEIPVSSLVFDGDGNVIAIGYNDRQKSKNVLGHAEINAILKAEKKVDDWRLSGYYMLSCMEPCDMCSAIIKESRLEKVYFLVENRNCSDVVCLNKELLTGYEEYKEKFNKLLTDFFNNMR